MIEISSDQDISRILDEICSNLFDYAQKICPEELEGFGNLLKILRNDFPKLLLIPCICRINAGLPSKLIIRFKFEQETYLRVGYINNHLVFKINDIAGGWGNFEITKRILNQHRELPQFKYILEVLNDSN